MSSSSGPPSSGRSGSGRPKGPRAKAKGAKAAPSDARRPSGPSGGGNRSKQGRRAKDTRRDAAPTPTPRADRSGWGSVAKHGAAGATHGQRLDEAEGPSQFSDYERARYAERQARRAKAADRMEDLRSEARAAIDRSAHDGETGRPPSGPTVIRRPLPGRPPQPKDVRRELTKARGDERGQREYKLYLRAAREFESERFEDARRTMRPLVDGNPGIAELRELYGLALYRLGHWDLAIEELEAFRTLSGTAEQHPPLMDAHRALGNWSDVDELWAELGEASPSADVMIEGRIVRASAEADKGELDSAIRILEKGWKPPKQVRDHHLRRAYVLADLYERAGRVPRSRALFAWLEQVAPDYLDVAARLRELG